MSENENEVISPKTEPVEDGPLSPEPSLNDTPVDNNKEIAQQNEVELPQEANLAQNSIKEEKLEDKEETNKKIEFKLEEEKYENDADKVVYLRNMMYQIKDAYDDIERENQDYKELLKIKNRQIDRLTNDRNSLDEKFEQFKTNIEISKIKLVATLREEVNRLNSELLDTKTLIKQRDTEILNLNEKCNEIKKAHYERVQVFEEKVQELRNIEKEKDDKINKMRDELEIYKTTQRRQSQKINELNSDILYHKRKLTDREKELKDEIEEFKFKLEYQEREIKRLEDENEKNGSSSSGEMKRLQNEINFLKERVNDLKRSNSKLEHDLKEARLKQEKDNVIDEFYGNDNAIKPLLPTPTSNEATTIHVNFLAKKPHSRTSSYEGPRKVLVTGDSLKITKRT